jgi:hypothetical protein
MTKIYDIRNDVERQTQGTRERLTVLDYPKVPVGHFFINHSNFRDTSRWVHVERKRPFEVARKGSAGAGWTTYGWYKTLDLAIKAAEKFLE